MKRRRPLTFTRRAALRAAGYSLGLPWLEAMSARGAAAQTLPAPRVLFVYFPNGYTEGQWVRGPAAGASNARLELPALARALEPWKSKLSLVTGLANQPASVSNGGAGIHSRGTGCSLVCQPLTPQGFAGDGVSADQVIARAIGGDHCLSSLVVGLPGERVPTFSEEGYGAIYYNNVSFTGPRSSVQKVQDPEDLFLRLVTCPGWSGRAPGGSRARFEKGVMSAVKEKAARLLGCASPTDRLRLEEYFTAVSELERRFLPGAAATASCTPPARPTAPGPAITLAEAAAPMADLTVLALRCGLTRVATVMMDGAMSRRSFGLPGLGSVNYLHGLSHGEVGGKEADDPRWMKITTHYFELIAQLLAKLDAVKEGDRTLLDNTIVYIHSEFGNGDKHQHGEQPLIIAGGAGRLPMGRHIAAPAGMPQANALLTVMRAMGLDRPSFGDSTGTVPGLAL